MDTILVSQLRKSYGPVRAVDGLSFRVGPGEVYGLLGPNGAGKTTTVETLIGLRNRDGGEVKVLGLDPEHQSRELKTRIGVQLQASSLYPRLTVRETVRLFANFYPKPLPADEVIALVGLKEKAKVQTRSLSGGQLQRLAAALALIGDGEIIFLDEPTTGLDPQARRGLWDLIQDLKHRGKTVFLTTHYMDEAERLCDRVAVVDHGQIIAEGPPRVLIEAYFRERAVEFVKPKSFSGEQLTKLPGVQRVQEEDERTTLYTTEASQTVAALLTQVAANGTSLEDAGGKAG
ncbi:MAG: ABC transporter ATP-binding protein, partial [Firmicutes bacterium]|nr:ABC transporter ATP-binding protein [Bacillota bacterium]